MIPLRDDNPAGRKPYVTVTLIVLCVLVFLWQFSHDDRGQQLIALELGVVPALLFGDPPLPEWMDPAPALVTVFTCMFLHGGWMHLIGNMWYLWLFGDNVEDAMGHRSYIVFYLVCGIAAVLAHALPAAGSTVPMVGASGAISGVLGAYLVLYPHARVLVLIPFGYLTRIVHLPAVAVLGFWFVFQLIPALTAPKGGGGVAFGAHVGGFVAGMALVALFKRRGVKLWQRHGAVG